MISIANVASKMRATALAMETPTMKPVVWVIGLVELELELHRTFVSFVFPPSEGRKYLPRNRTIYVSKINPQLFLWSSEEGDLEFLRTTVVQPRRDIKQLLVPLEVALCGECLWRAAIE